MAKTKISEFSSTPANNTDIDSINLAEGCAPSGINDAIRELMAQLKDWQSGTSNDPYVVGSSGSLTLNQGTANGVAYLNGSKVVTSGTALQFDGTNLVNNSGSFQGNDNATVTAVVSGTNGTVATISSAGTGGIIKFNTAGSEKARINSNGILGLGVTPSTSWASGRPAMQIGTAMALDCNNPSQAIMSANRVATASQDLYINSSYASSYLQLNGAHSWYTAPSGTAGNAITFTQAMTLSAAGDLLVGTTGSGARMRVDSAGSTSATNIVQFNNSSAVEALRVRSDGAVFTGSSGSGLAACPYNNTTANAANMVVGTGGDFQRSTSARKYKQDIRDLENIDIGVFRAVRYKSKCVGDDQTKDYFGVIADEVDAAGIKELVNYGANGEVEGFQYERLTVVLVKAIQELKAEFDAYKASHP